jgi:hypothetical protein
MAHSNLTHATVAVELVLAVATILLVLVLTAHAATPDGINCHIGATTAAIAIAATGGALIGFFTASLLAVGGRT